MTIDSDFVEEFICWEFGTGVCTPKKIIPNVEKYLELIKETNSSNYAEKYAVYWNNLGHQEKTNESLLLKNRIEVLRQLELNGYRMQKSSDVTINSLFIVIPLYTILICLLIAVTAYKHYYCPEVKQTQHYYRNKYVLFRNLNTCEAA